MSVRKRHIVLITSWYPPKNGVAVNRMLGFTKYLDHERNQITVLTDRPEGAPEQEYTGGVQVYRISPDAFMRKAQFRAGEPKSLHLMKVLWNVLLSRFTGPTDHAWAKKAAGQLRSLHSQQPIDVVISSYAPSAAHVAAYEFCKGQPAVRWVADMRDEMSSNPHLSVTERKELAEVELLVNERADAVTAVSHPILADFQRLLPSVGLFEEVRNGFDHSLSFEYTYNDFFTISYAGTFYGQRKPHTFFKGLELFLKRHSIDFRLRFIGVNRNFMIPELFLPNCEFVAKMSADDAVSEIAHSDANLLVLPKLESMGVFSGKLFEYCSIYKPIIAVVDPSDVAASLINELNIGFVADFDDPGSIATAIEKAYYLWKEKKSLPVNREKVLQLHRKYQVQRLEKLIDKLAGL